jgi:hypothetical protein
MMSRFNLVYTFLIILSIFPAQLLGAGIPIVDGVNAELSMKEIVQKAVRVVRDEAYARIVGQASIKISEDRNSSDENIAANTVSRITSAITAASNRQADTKSSAYIDACGIVSVARTTSQSAASGLFSVDISRRVASFARDDQNSNVKEAIQAYKDAEDLNKLGSIRNEIRERAKEFDKNRLEALSQSVLNISKSSAYGLNAIFSYTLPDVPTAERVYLIRTMLLGEGMLPQYPGLVPNRSDPDLEARQKVEEGRHEVIRSAKGVSAAIMNTQTSIIETNHLPLEGAVSEMASHQRQERLAVGSVNSVKTMTDHAMLQSIVISKSANLVAMLQEYRRGQAVLLQLASLHMAQ